MTIECEIDVYEKIEFFQAHDYCEVSVFGSMVGAANTVSGAIQVLADYLTRNYAGMAHSLKVTLGL